MCYTDTRTRPLRDSRFAQTGGEHHGTVMIEAFDNGTVAVFSQCFVGHVRGGGSRSCAVTLQRHRGHRSRHPTNVGSTVM